jgi:hypothetical protein
VASVLLGAVLAITAFYWAVAAFVNVGVALHRLTGYGSISALPAVGALAGLHAALILREWFGLVASPLVYLIALVPDLAWQAGEFAFWVRLRVLGWPDKSLRGGDGRDKARAEGG